MSEIIVPPYLKEGDTVGILCTARFIDKNELTASIDLLESWGLKVKLGKTIGKRVDQMGGSDEEKIADFQSMIEDASINCIWCARGGYGTVRIVDRIDFQALLQKPKWLVGFSDITVLHSHLQQELNLSSLHAMLCSTVSKSNEASVISLKDALFGKRLKYSCAPNQLNRSGDAIGKLCGGNLSVLYSLLGSKSDIDTNGKILFLEDLDEYLYHVDRMMMALKRAGKLDSLAGLIVGGMTKMNDNEIPFGSSAEEIIAEHTASYNYPVCFAFPSGHQAENLSLKMGASAHLSVSAKSCELTFQ